MPAVQSVHHVGIAVRSIDAQRRFYEETLGAEFEGVEEVTDQKVRVGFFRIGDIRLELLEPTDPSSTIALFLEKRGEGLHHIAFSVRISKAGSPSWSSPLCVCLRRIPVPARTTCGLPSSIPRARLAY